MRTSWPRLWRIIAIFSMAWALATAATPASASAGQTRSVSATSRSMGSGGQRLSLGGARRTNGSSSATRSRSYGSGATRSESYGSGATRSESYGSSATRSESYGPSHASAQGGLGHTAVGGGVHRGGPVQDSRRRFGAHANFQVSEYYDGDSEDFVYSDDEDEFVPLPEAVDLGLGKPAPINTVAGLDLGDAVREFTFDGGGSRERVLELTDDALADAGANTGEYRAALYDDVHSVWAYLYIAWRTAEGEATGGVDPAVLERMRSIFSEREVVNFDERTAVHVDGAPGDASSRFTVGADGPPVARRGAAVLRYRLQTKQDMSLVFHPAQGSLPPFVGWVDSVHPLGDNGTYRRLRDTEALASAESPALGGLP